MRIKHFILSALFVSALLLSPRIGSAQFVNGKVFLGPHIGLSAFGSAPVSARILKRQSLNREKQDRVSSEFPPEILELLLRIQQKCYSPHILIA